MKRQFQTFAFSIQNSSSQEAVDIHIDGNIVDAETQQILKDWFGDDSSVSFKSFRKQLESVEAKVFNVYINSGGGLVTDAMAIHDLLIDMQSKGKTVNTIGRGIIASAATYILMAGGKNSSMSKNSWFMIHNVSGAIWGDVNMVESYAATLRKFNDSARDFYARATGKRKEDITKMMDAETWMTADEAKENGFISQVSGEVNFTNSIAKEHWQFSNTAVLNAYNSAVKPPQPTTPNFQNQIDEMKKFFQDLGKEILNAINGIKPTENNDHAALMSNIGNAVNSSFSNASEQLDAAVNEAATTAVVNAINSDKENPVKTAFQNAVSSAVAATLKENETIKNLGKQITDLETEIATKLGNPSNSNQDKGEKPIGGFKD